MKLLYFAQIRELIGQGEEEVEPPAHLANMADLMAWLSERSGSYKTAMALENLCMAINQEFAEPESPLTGAEEIAFFPPMTGG